MNEVFLFSQLHYYYLALVVSLTCTFGNSIRHSAGLLMKNKQVDYPGSNQIAKNISLFITTRKAPENLFQIIPFCLQ